ncbi:MAG: NUDIX hydrolase [Candidatus Dactylopiibacterium carminicum]|uniref:GDP-mannose pyrophosphatase n=1 Tax=Candidatus Dactylopiibacterium carminicum TaxID=857335 RepID=A0A272EQ35_9RHOO|nr:NUDIX hydrolase [Candidatus Dactylopiibacterium carminicum]KAF7598416.1 NUDIX hydrolase [Candidatus Dactylopiibacterium carminicum]PAS92191.1 MAG: NUDIX hydrolase [Candidatus Dactylopiibacterium carminicum]PAS95659.1 MAG: NUDIX hydrolase [Candidatus Dactylopiibacterium carminicum]PAS97650.1 MAG: NUDIX hydrolase [Candidatus Dactylopiibacterium carminicum]
MDEGLIERRIDGGEVFRGNWIRVQRDRIRLPDGKEATREFVRHPGACVIIPELRPGVLLFERQFRYPVGQVFIELPAGKIDPEEDLLDCARRELLEETGYTAGVWEHLGCMHNCIGYSDERIEIFLARDMKPGQQQLDDGEFVELFEMSLKDAAAAVLDGRITDAKTITCLFWLQQKLG